MANKSTELEELWERLDGQVGSSQLKKAAKTIDAILKLDNVHETALHIKGVLLVKMGKHDELLKLLEKPSGKRVAQLLAFEKAYCLYRLNMFQDALTALEQVGEERVVAKLHLQAQLCHRLGRSNDCITAYSDLFSKHKDESLELRTNVLAAYVENKRASEIPEVMDAMKISGENSYEVAFNKACGLIDHGKLIEAEEQLLLAQRIGQETLYSEDLKEEEVEEEMAPVKVQLAFVASCLGRRSEAAVLTEEAVKATKNDPATRAVGETNLAAVRILDQGRKSGLGDSLKRLEAMLARPGVTSQLDLQPELASRLNSSQQLAVHYNRVVLMLHTGKIDSARAVVRAMESTWPGAETLLLLKAALIAAEGKIAEADGVLSRCSARKAVLLRCQLVALTEPEKAADLLDSVGEGDFSFSPAVIATKVALLRRAGATAKLNQLLEAATTYWSRTQGSTKVNALSFLLEAQAQAHLEAGNVTEAAASLATLREEYHPEDMALLVKLVKTTAVFDIEAAGRLGASLPELESLAAVDVEEEVQAIVARARGKSEKRRDVDGAKSKKKRKRAPLYPKGFDPKNPGPPPDPERWLPKWQRSDFRKKKRGQHLRAQQQNVKGSQGAGKVDENLDRSSVAASTTAAPSPSGQQERATTAKKGKKSKR